MERPHALTPFSLGLDLLRATELGLGGLPARTPAGPRLQGRVGRDTVEVRAEVPGFGPDDLELSLEGATLHLALLGKPDPDSGERAAAHRAHMKLPFRVDADAVEATFRHGLLEVVLHRLKPERRAITVQLAE
jgi:HSP20 family molecular chaperone IbpA